MFTTGIENSYPTVDGRRVDEMEKCRHYEMWRQDFDLVDELEIKFLRYGPPIHRTFLGPDKFDWSFADDTFLDLKRRNIVPIADLCHFGVPDWVGNFQNPDFPELLRPMSARSRNGFRGCSSIRRSTRCTSAPCSLHGTVGGMSN